MDGFRKSELVDSLIDHEGLVLHQYVDSEGYATIGIGRLIDPEKGGKIKIINIVSKKISEVEHNLNYFVHGQGGLLDIIYKDKKLWISYSENRGNSKTSTSIAKTKLDKKKLSFKKYN